MSMYVQKMEMISELTAMLAGAELDGCNVRNCVLGSAVVVTVTNHNVNTVVDVCHEFGGHMDDASDYDVNQLR